MSKIVRLGIFPNLDKEKVHIALPEILSMCKDWGLNPLLPMDIAKEYGCDGYDVNQPATLLSMDGAVSLGGDGTLLQMARQLLPYNIPIFGVNFGHLGFLAEIDLRGISRAIARLAQGNYNLEHRTLLQAVVQNENTGTTKAVAHALNEFVLAKGIFSKMANIRMFISGKPSGSYKADGLIVATATGSTAYNLSAGGPLVMPELDLKIVTPVCAHSLQARALVLPMDEAIDLRAVPGSEELVLASDGENIVSVVEGDVVHIERSPYQVKLIRLTSRDYYQTWQQKLMRSY